MKLDLIVNENDEYYTPLYAIIPLIKYLEKGTTVWCPFDTEESLFVTELKKRGFKVLFTHISKGQDFFEIVDNFIKENKVDYIVSNPPYSKKGEVLLKLFSLNIPFAMLVGVVGIFESKKRFNMFKNNDFEILFLDKRVSFFKSYSEQKPSKNPPFQSVYICSKILPKQIMFEEIDKNNII